YRDGGIKINPLRDPIKDLDSLLRPAWHLFSMRNYRKTLVRADGNKMLSMGLVSSRGCPYDCVFCANSALSQKRVSFMSPKRFVGELEFLNREYGFTAFDFWDDTFTVNKSHVLGVCDEILKRNLKINWYARCRIDTVDREVLQLMKKAGCVTLSYGIESGSPRISKVIRKNINLQKAREVVKQSADLGFCVLTFFMAGHPGETAEDLKMTLNLMDEFKAYSPHIKPTIGFTLIYPKTGLEEIARKNLLLPQHFSWNKPVSLGTSVFSAREDSIPIFENPDFKLPLMKIMIFERVNKKAGFLTKARKFFSVLFSIKGWKECKNVARLTFSYLRQSLINRYHET
ncbi:MAG: B12-binding domain-containing radical SAM protein, partial [Candidatus Omnitrophica bacterium]|nr:B12-binding domain-containing radical SAM protein [Candidatus Omnitrophota bacterium]